MGDEGDGASKSNRDLQKHPLSLHLHPSPQRAAVHCRHQTTRRPLADTGTEMGGRLMWTLPQAFRRAALKRWRRPIAGKRLAQQALVRSWTRQGMQCAACLFVDKQTLAGQPQLLGASAVKRRQRARHARQRPGSETSPRAHGGRAQRRQQGRVRLFVVLTTMPIKGVTSALRRFGCAGVRGGRSHQR